MKAILLFFFLSLALVSGWAGPADQLMEEAQQAVSDKKNKEAEKKFKEAVDQEPKNAEAHFQLATFWMNRAVETQNNDLLIQSIEESKTALKYDPIMGEAHDNLAHSYYLLQDYDKMYYHYRKAFAAGVRNPFLAEQVRLHLVRKNEAARKESKKTEATESLKTSTPVSSDDETGGGLVQ